MFTFRTICRVIRNKTVHSRAREPTRPSVMTKTNIITSTIIVTGLQNCKSAAISVTLASRLLTQNVVIARVPLWDATSIPSPPTGGVIGLPTRRIPEDTKITSS
jgi:hypothetical protein